jgi:nucleotide-binding universal stress UspA family protein
VLIRLRLVSIDCLKALIERAAKEAIASSPSPPAKLAIDLVENNPYMVMRNESGWPDLLVMGTHSKGRLATTVTVGKLARHLLAEVTCDVLVFAALTSKVMDR